MFSRQSVGQAHDDGEDHGRGAHDGGADQHRLGCRFERIAGAVIFFQQVFGAFKPHVKPEVLLEFRCDIWHVLNQ